MQECKSNSSQVPDLKMVKKLTAKLDGGKVKDQFANLSPPTLDVSRINNVKPVNVLYSWRSTIVLCRPCQSRAML